MNELQKELFKEIMAKHRLETYYVNGCKAAFLDIHMLAAIISSLSGRICVYEATLKNIIGSDSMDDIHRFANYALDKAESLK